MKTLARRDFLKMAGAGAVTVIAGAAVPVSGYFAWMGKGALRFRAVAGMPKAPWPAYASYVIEGKVDIRKHTGTLVKSIYAGAPDAMSGIAFPGTVRSVRVTSVKETGDSLTISGEIADRAALLKGESPAFNILVDRPNGLAHADFLGHTVVMRLD
jgi:hypothetical protein